MESNNGPEWSFPLCARAHANEKRDFPCLQICVKCARTPCHWVKRELSFSRPRTQVLIKKFLLKNLFFAFPFRGNFERNAFLQQQLPAACTHTHTLRALEQFRETRTNFYAAKVGETSERLKKNRRRKIARGERDVEKLNRIDEKTKRKTGRVSWLPLWNRIIKISIEARKYSMRISISFISQIEFWFLHLIFFAAKWGEIAHLR